MAMTFLSSLLFLRLIVAFYGHSSIVSIIQFLSFFSTKKDFIVLLRTFPSMSFHFFQTIFGHTFGARVKQLDEV